MTNSDEIATELNLSFSSPKSLSVATLVSTDLRLIEAHETIVKFTLKKMRALRC